MCGRFSFWGKRGEGGEGIKEPSERMNIIRGEHKAANRIEEYIEE